MNSAHRSHPFLWILDYTGPTRLLNSDWHSLATPSSLKFIPSEGPQRHLPLQPHPRHNGASSRVTVFLDHTLCPCPAPRPRPIPPGPRLLVASFADLLVSRKNGEARAGALSSNTARPPTRSRPAAPSPKSFTHASEWPSRLPFTSLGAWDRLSAPDS